MDAQPLLSLRLSVDYPDKLGVLRNLSLDIASREILGLVGQSGCGKSTLALAILKLLHLKRPRRGLDSLQWPRLDGVAGTRSSISAWQGNWTHLAESHVFAESGAAHWNTIGRSLEGAPAWLARPVPGGSA